MASLIPPDAGDPEHAFLTVGDIKWKLPSPTHKARDDLVTDAGDPKLGFLTGEENTAVAPKLDEIMLEKIIFEEFGSQEPNIIKEILLENTVSTTSPAHGLQPLSADSYLQQSQLKMIEESVGPKWKLIKEHILPKLEKPHRKGPTAEKILQEGAIGTKEIRGEADKPKQLEECYQRMKFERDVSNEYWKPSSWIRYAIWEESHNCFKARSIWERATNCDRLNPTIWIKYATLEMKVRDFNRARKVWDCAVHYLPLVDQLWECYIHMEEFLGNVGNARRLFERRMSRHNNIQGWLSYIKFELRYKDVEQARRVFERFVEGHPWLDSFIEFANFERKNGEIERERKVYKRAAYLVSGYEEEEKLSMAVKDFEQFYLNLHAWDAYKAAFVCVTKEQVEIFYKFMKIGVMPGDRHEDSIALVKRKLEENPLDYGSWFTYINLVQTVGNKNEIRHVYDQAIANVPLVEEKPYWKQYIWLWIYYALYEELQANDMSRARNIYSKCLRLIPHKKFSFAKIWLMAALFEIRKKKLDVARQILNYALTMAPKDKIYKTCIEIELRVNNINRCRTLYKKYLDWAPSNCYMWTNYAHLELLLGETEQARAILNRGINQIALHMSEFL